ncbi:MAG: addiction module protein [Acidobacteriota bacterium]|nr:MAG: addiction module protein [Acidobacteriota bacterium]
MTVQTIPDIEQMTPAQQIELMEALWKSMTERNVNSEPPAWHRDYLADRENAVANGEDEFISLDELEADLKAELK